MKHFILLAAGLLAGILTASAQHAGGILDKAASVCNQPGGITASFVMQTRSPQLSESFEGVIHIKGDKFALSTPDIKTWYDGLTQWTYMEHTGEVNITTPEGDELQLTNPGILLRTYQKGFTAAYQGEGTATNGKAAYIIALTPKTKTDITRVEVQIEKHSSLPVRIHVEMKNKLSNTIQISDIKTSVNRPDSFFSFPKADYPEAEVVDLR
jgi:outer membrane lipoprotein-sorting protein